MVKRGEGRAYRGVVPVGGPPWLFIVFLKKSHERSQLRHQIHTQSSLFNSSSLLFSSLRKLRIGLLPFHVDEIHEQCQSQHYIPRLRLDRGNPDETRLHFAKLKGR